MRLYSEGSLLSSHVHLAFLDQVLPRTRTSVPSIENTCEEFAMSHCEANLFLHNIGQQTSLPQGTRFCDCREPDQINPCVDASRSVGLPQMFLSLTDELFQRFEGAFV
jgi:hypothetical protein